MGDGCPYIQPEWEMDVYIHNLNGGWMSIYTTRMQDICLYTQPGWRIGVYTQHEWRIDVYTQHEWRIDVYIHNLDGG